MHVERELKYDLATLANRNALLAALPGERTTEYQENFFFDDPERSLLRSRRALRIRFSEIKGKEPGAEICLKGDTKQRGALAERPEYSAPIDIKLARDILRGKVKLTELDIPPVELAKPHLRGELVRLVTFINERVTVPLAMGDSFLNFEVDLTGFPSGDPEYELEIESPDLDLLNGAETLAHKLAGMAGFELRPQLKSKFQRAVERAGLEFNS